MNTKIMLALAIVALSSGWCEGRIDNIFGEKDEKIYSKEEIDSRLTDEYAPNPREVASLLIKADYKFQPLEASKGVEIDELLDLTSPYHYCRPVNFAEFDEWRNLFSGPDGNVYLMNYVKTNTERLMKVCATDIENILSGAVRDVKVQYRWLINRYVLEYAREDDPQEKVVKGFFSKWELSEEEKRELIDGCAELVPHIRKCLLFFLKDEKKVSHRLNNLGNYSAALEYKRCKVINQMFGKQ